MQITYLPIAQLGRGGCRGNHSSSRSFKEYKPCRGAAEARWEVGCRVWKQSRWDAGWLRQRRALLRDSAMNFRG